MKVIQEEIGYTGTITIGYQNSNSHGNIFARKFLRIREEGSWARIKALRVTMGKEVYKNPQVPGDDCHMPPSSHQKTKKAGRFRQAFGANRCFLRSAELCKQLLEEALHFGDVRPELLVLNLGPRSGNVDQFHLFTGVCLR